MSWAVHTRKRTRQPVVGYAHKTRYAERMGNKIIYYVRYRRKQSESVCWRSCFRIARKITRFFSQPCPTDWCICCSRYWAKRLPRKASLAYVREEVRRRANLSTSTNPFYVDRTDARMDKRCFNTGWNCENERPPLQKTLPPKNLWLEPHPKKTQSVRKCF